MSKRMVLCLSLVAGLITTTAGCDDFCTLLGLDAGCLVIVGGNNDDNGNDNNDDNDNDNNDGDDNNGGGGNTGDATAGHTYFTANCQGCHGADASGNIGPNIQSKNAADLLSKIDGSHNGVTAITQTEADNLAAWLATQ